MSWLGAPDIYIYIYIYTVRGTGWECKIKPKSQYSCKMSHFNR